MDNNVKDTKHTIHIYRIMHFLINGEELNLHQTFRCEVGLKRTDIRIKNFIEDGLNPSLGYFMVRLDNYQNICRIGVTEYRRF